MAFSIARAIGGRGGGRGKVAGAVSARRGGRGKKRRLRQRSGIRDGGGERGTSEGRGSMLSRLLSGRSRMKRFGY
jgi:hypothetical protein